MSSWPSSDASAASVTLSAPEVQAGQTLFGSSSGYSILDFIGEGCFGKVAKCQNLATKETVAVKILKKDVNPDTEKEVSMLKIISVLNPDHTNVVQFFERFEYMGQTCLAFEILDRSLYDLLKERDWKPLSLNEIRPIAKQMLVALDALKGLSVLHTDIKPDNIMFVNMRDQPLRVKLIDFGEAILASKVQPGLELQPIGYRAPEIALGFPFTEAIDMWGVGCILAFLYLAENLFPVDCNYQMMKCMVEVLGQPADHLLRAGIYTRYFFSKEEAADGPAWRLMTPEEYTAVNNIEAEQRHSFIELPSSLDDLVNIYPKEDAAEFEDRKVFVDIMKGLLHLDGDQRITPFQALEHSFITMSHLTEHLVSRTYLATSQTMMSICPLENSADRVNTSAASAVGFCIKGPSFAPATRSFDGTKATVANDDGPTIGSSDGVPIISSYDKDPPAWSSAGRQLSPSYDEDPAPGSSDGGPPSPSCDKDLTTQSSSGGPPSPSFDKDPAPSSSDGRPPDLTAWSFDGGPLSSSNDVDPVARSFEGAKPTDSTAADSASSGGTRKSLKQIQRFFTAICCCRCSAVED